ncbi:MAG: pyridoxamine 5'-phosphate oxidase family protein [Bacteroidota bacterium]
MEQFSTTERNKVKRIPKRGHYDKATVYEILDAAFVAHVGFAIDGQPFIIPTAYGRKEDVIYLHGASTSRMLVALKEQAQPICITVTHLDGIVVARSTFHSSMNYRSAVVFGKGELVEGEEKMEALEIITENILKGRWDEARQPKPNEMKATAVLKVTIEQASAKIRTGSAGDDKADEALPIWAGVLPMKQIYEAPIPDELLAKTTEIPESVQRIFAE